MRSDRWGQRWKGFVQYRGGANGKLKAVVSLLTPAGRDEVTVGPGSGRQVPENVRTE